MKKYLFLLTLFTTLIFADDYSIDDYNLYWKLGTFGDIEIVINKSPDETFVQIRPVDSLAMMIPMSLTKTDAKNLHDVLAVLKKEDNNLKRNGFIISRTKDNPNRILLSRDTLFGDPLLIKQSQLKKIVSALKDIDKKIEYLNKKVESFSE